MPLDEDIRTKVTHYISRDVVPKTVKPHPEHPMEWFMEQFDFIGDLKLREHLAEAFYQARYIGRVREALDLAGNFNHAFCKYQILLYASIYEAIIDYLLEAVSDDLVVTELLNEKVLQKIKSALSSKTRIIYSDTIGDHDLIPCREIVRSRKLREIQFDDRVDTALKLGILRNDDSESIKLLYKSRNNIHLQASAIKDFKPDDKQSSDAFRRLFKLVQHAKTWCKARDIK